MMIGPLTFGDERANSIGSDCYLVSGSFGELGVLYSVLRLSPIFST